MHPQASNHFHCSSLLLRFKGHAEGSILEVNLRAADEHPCILTPAIHTFALISSFLCCQHPRLGRMKLLNQANETDCSCQIQLPWLFLDVVGKIQLPPRCACMPLCICMCGLRLLWHTISTFKLQSIDMAVAAARLQPSAAGQTHDQAIATVQQASSPHDVGKTLMDGREEIRYLLP